MSGPAVGGAGTNALRWGYNTNGFANHRLADALCVIADLGYAGVSLTLDHHHLDPFAADLKQQVRAVRRQLQHLELSVLIETGARYLLDPMRKHYPSLVSPDNRPRLRLLERAIDIAAELGGEAVSFWSGIDCDNDAGAAWRRLVDGVGITVAYAERAGVRLGLEPEPGMVVENTAQYLMLHEEIDAPPTLGLTLDIGHCQCLEPLPIADRIRATGGMLVNVQIDDMVRGTHEHLEFGSGEVDFPPVLHALREVGYHGLVSVELPRHSHAAPDVARRSLEFLRAAAQPILDPSGRPA